MGRRRSRPRGGVSRRRFLVGGLLSIGGVSVLGGTQAFSRTDATRTTSVQTASDQNALLGVEPVASVQAGIDGQTLVTLTNNTDDTIDVTVSLDDTSQGSLSPTTETLGSGAATTVDVSVAWDSPVGANALPFSVTASNGGDLSVSLTRAVDVTEPPQLLHQIYDQTANTNVSYDIAYRIRNLADFDRIEIDVENLDAGHIDASTFTEATSEATVSYPDGGGNDGGAGGNTYEFRFRVYDSTGRVAPLDDTLQDVADGDDPPGDDLGGPNDPQLESFTLVDDTRNNNTDFTLDYEVSNLGEFQDVRVTFEVPGKNWVTDTQTNASAPTGTVTHSQGGTGGDEYEITVEVRNTSGITVDSGSITHVSGSSNSESWP